MDVSTPALLFGSISLLLLSYTNRFLAIARLIRELHENKDDTEQEMIALQIPILRKRLQLIKGMQMMGLLSFILCTAALFSLFLDLAGTVKICFTLSVLALLFSLTLGLIEIFTSTKALDIILKNTQK